MSKENDSFKPSTMDQHIQSLLLKLTQDYIRNFDISKEELENILMYDYVKKELLNKINNITIDNVINDTNNLQSFSREKFENIYNRLLPILEGLLCIARIKEEDILRIIEKLSNNSNMLLFKRNNINTDITIELRENLKNTLIDKMNVILSQQLKQNNHELLSMIMSSIQAFILAMPNGQDNKSLIEIGKKTGLFDETFNRIQVNGFKVPNNTIFAEASIFELLEYIKNNDIENLNEYIQKNKNSIPKNIIQTYKNNGIDYDIFYMLITHPILNANIPEFKGNLKILIKPLLVTEHNENYTKVTQKFTFNQIYSLVKIGFIDDIDLMTVYTIQKSFLESRLILDIDYLEKHLCDEALITEEQLTTYLTPQKFLSLYFDVRYDNLKEDIVNFYQAYVLSTESTSEINVFEKEILKNKNLSDKKIIELFSIGLVSNNVLGKLKEDNDKLKLLLKKYIKDLYETNKIRNHKHIFDLMKDGVLSQSEAISILGKESYENIIRSNLNTNENQLIPSNIGNLENLGFIKPYIDNIDIDKIEQEIFSSSSITPTEILKFYSAGLISNAKIKERKNENIEFKEKLYKFIKSNSSDILTIVYFVKQGILDEFELIDILGDENFENFIKNGLVTKAITAVDLQYFSFIDKKLLLDMYNSEKNLGEEDNKIDFKYLIQVYLSNNEYITLEDIESILFATQKSDLNGTNLSSYIYHAIQSTQNINIEKIRELYLKNYLIFSDLSKLVDEEIVSSEQAREINQEFCGIERLNEIQNFDINANFKTKKTKNSNENLNPNANQIEQSKTMVETLKSLGYSPKYDDNQQQAEMSTFPVGKLQDYRIFISEENPDVIILMHLKQNKNSRKYYKGNENKTYVVATSDFYNYLTLKEKGLGLSSEELINLETTRTVHIGKKWNDELQSSIEQINNMLNATTLQEQKVEGDKEIKIDEPDRKVEK